MRVETTRFGPLEIEEATVLYLDRGLLGFGQYHRYVLLQSDENSPFRWLQCLDEPSLAFVVADPLQWFPDYTVHLSDADAAELELTGPDDAGICVVVTLPSRLEEMTANLLGPIIINVRTRRAAQVVLDDPRYHTRHPLVSGAPQRVPSAA
ncbi:MAG: flagellar assembly protein FliW [Armatimonadetes bacterium]|nr:flagellar assembly protein FliW [Armatimonadota bacterium]